MNTSTTVAPPREPSRSASTSKTMTRTGHVLSTVAVLFLLMDVTMKLLALPVVMQTSAQLGWAGTPHTARTLGAILLICTALYVFPRTSILGAILLTGYLGGAVSTHLRVSSPLLTHTLFGVYLGVLVWAGLYLRDERLRALARGVQKARRRKRTAQTWGQGWRRSVPTFHAELSDPGKSCRPFRASIQTVAPPEPHRESLRHLTADTAARNPSK
jgi:DoxX-like family